MLLMSVESFYGLKEKPFTLLPNPRFIYLSEPYLETKSKLLYFLKEKTASLYLYGGIGTGKTSLLRFIAQEISDDPGTEARYVIASSNLRTPNQFIRTICDEFGIKTARSQQQSQLNLQKFLGNCAKKGKSPLVLVDEAQNLSRAQLKLIHDLLNFVGNDQVLIMFVLVGQPDLIAKIDLLPSLKSRLISASLSGMTRADLESMIKFRWSITSRSGTTPPFNKEGYDVIYQITKGNPRMAVKLCSTALLHGFLKKAKEISPAIIRKASKEL